MLAMTWEQISPAVYIVLGSGLTLLSTSWVERKRFDREEARLRRIATRDALRSLSQSVSDVQVWVNRRMGLGAIGQGAPAPTYTTDDFNDFAEVVAPMMAQRWFIDDDELQSLVAAVVPGVVFGLQSTTTKELAEHVHAASQAFLAANTRIGELLRTTYA